MLVEILSPNNPRHDQVTKFNLYEQAGVAEYWLVDPDAHIIDVFGLGKQGTYSLLGRFGAGETVTSEVLPGFSVAVDEIIPVEK